MTIIWWGETTRVRWEMGETTRVRWEMGETTRVRWEMGETTRVRWEMDGMDGWLIAVDAFLTFLYFLLRCHLAFDADRVTSSIVYSGWTDLLILFVLSIPISLSIISYSILFILSTPMIISIALSTLIFLSIDSPMFCLLLCFFFVFISDLICFLFWI
jgi:hypothetical protein